MNPAYRFKITDITEEKSRTKEYRDKTGKLKREQVPVTVKRPVRVISGGARFLHFIIDQLFIGVLTACIELLPVFVHAEGFSFGSVITLMSVSPLRWGVTFVYYLLFEIFTGSTPAKTLLGRTVINEYAEKADAGVCAVRTLIRLIPFEAFSCISERGWHDQWSNTFVVAKEEAEKLRILREEQEKEMLLKWEAYRQQQQQGNPVR